MLHKISFIVAALASPFLFSIFEAPIADGKAAAMAGAVSAVRMENAFIRNPANMFLNTDHYLAVTGGLRDAAFDDIKAVDVSVFHRMMLKGNVGWGACIDVSAYPYSGSYPGAESKLLWYELLVDNTLCYKTLNSLHLGISLRFLQYGTKAEVHGNTRDSVGGLDLRLGMLYTYGDLVLSFGGENIINFIPGLGQQMVFGASYRLLDKITPALDLVLLVNQSSMNLNLGSAFELSKRLELAGGFSFVDLFNTFIATTGVAFKLNAIEIAYSLEYNFSYLGYGEHSFTFGVKY